jgi:hypothetical protein
MAADPDRACLHQEFDATVEVNRIADDPTRPPTAYMADIRVSCKQCGEPFRWTGCRAGAHFQGPPMVSADETELRAPLRPASADPDFGMGLPGFAIGFRPGPAMGGGSDG